MQFLYLPYFLFIKIMIMIMKNQKKKERLAKQRRIPKMAKKKKKVVFFCLFGQICKCFLLKSNTVLINTIHLSLLGLL